MTVTVRKLLSTTLCAAVVFSVFTTALADSAAVIDAKPGGEPAVNFGPNTRSGIVISAVTADSVIGVGDDLTLTVVTNPTAAKYTWELSADGGTNWSTLPDTSLDCNIVDAAVNTPASVPYQYRITVEDAGGATDSATIRVLVSNDYEYKKLSLRNGQVDVSSYMHKQTRLVIKELSDSDAAAAALVASLTPGFLPVLICDVSLDNQGGGALPYFGPVELEFHVGGEYDGQSLTVFHQNKSGIRTYTGYVSGGILTITVDELSPFMVEAATAAGSIHTVAASALTGGTISPSGNVYVADGAGKTFTFLPDAGYAIDTVTVNGASVTFTGNAYTLDSISENMTIAVRFREVTPSETLYELTAFAGPRGAVSPSGTMQIRHGMAQVIYFYPENNYELDKLTVNDVEVNVLGDSYLISAVEGDVAVHATFRSATTQVPGSFKTVAASAGVNGQISPAGDVNVGYGGEIYFYFIPNTGYELDEVTVDGTVTSVSAPFYRLANVTDDHTIHVTFRQTVIPPAPTQYRITQGQNGSWAEGGTGGLRFTADADYAKFTGVSLDGNPVSTSNYTSESGSTIVTLKASYLETLAAGRYTLRLTFTDGYAEARFTVRAAAIPATGDSAQPMLWLGVVLLACAGLAASRVLRRKRQKG